MKKIILSGLLCAAFVGLVGCASAPKSEITDIASLNTKEQTIAVALQFESEKELEQNLPKATIHHFTSLPDGIAAIETGKYDGLVLARHILEAIAATNDKVAVLDESMAELPINVGVALENKELLGEVNAFIAALQKDGTLDEMYTRWVRNGSDIMPNIAPPTAPTRKLRVITSGECMPMTYYKGTELWGYDIELAKRFAAAYQYELEFIVMSYAAMPMALQTGKADCVMANLFYQEEWTDKIQFTNPYITTEIAVLVNKERLADPKGATADEPGNGPKYKELSDFSGEKISTYVGTLFAELIEPSIPNGNYHEFNSIADATEALRKNKIDAMPLDQPVAELLVIENPDFVIFPEVVFVDTYGIAVAKGSKLGVLGNEVLEQLRAQGTLVEMKEKWISSDESKKGFPSPPEGYDGSAGVIKFGYVPYHIPMTYQGESRIALGYEVELGLRIAHALNMKFETVPMDTGTIVPAVQGGKVDMAAGTISITDERKKKIDFIGPDYNGGIVLVVKKEFILGQSTKADTPENGFMDGLKESFTKTFLTENRYKLVASGLGITLIISLLSALFGTAFGVLICALYGSKFGLPRTAAKLYIRLIQGMPIIVMLMLLYYVIFGKLDLSAIIVAIIGFSLNFAAYTAEMFRTGMQATDKGQVEAAYACGFSKLQAFIHITLPQAAKHVIPLYRGEFINMVKTTSVVGYIAIQDLTKASDIIRSRTFEAFFPLIATAVIYFGITYIFIFILNLIEKKVDPKRRKRIREGTNND